MADKSRFGPELTEAEINMEELLILEFLIKQFFYSGLLDIYRGYYMAARGYEFYLRVMKVSLTSERSKRVRDTFSTRG